MRRFLRWLGRAWRREAKPLKPMPGCFCPSCRVVAPLLNALRDKLDERHPLSKCPPLAPPYEPDLTALLGADGKLRPEIRHICDVSLYEKRKAEEFSALLNANRTPETP